MEVSTFNDPSAPHSAKRNDVKSYYAMSLDQLVQKAKTSLNYLKEKNSKTQIGRSVPTSLQNRIDTEKAIALLCINIICKYHVEQPEGGLTEELLRKQLPAGLLKEYDLAGIDLMYKKAEIKKTINEEEMAAA